MDNVYLTEIYSTVTYYYYYIIHCHVLLSLKASSRASKNNYKYITALLFLRTTYKKYRQKYRKKKAITTQNKNSSAGLQLLNYTMHIHNVRIHIN